MTDGEAAHEPRVRVLQTRIRELEVRCDLYLDRIRQLEAHIGAGGTIATDAGVTAGADTTGPGARGGGTDRSQEIAQLQRQLVLSQRAEREKEIVIAELVETSEERLRLVQQLDAEGTQLREAQGLLTDQLQQKEQVIAGLAASADERLRLIERLDAELVRLRGASKPQTVDDEARP